MIPDPRATHIWRVVAILAVLAIAILACTRKPEDDAKATTTSAKGKRIVSVGGAVTETVFALGGGVDVVGVDTSSVFPEEVFKLPKVGYQRTLSAEGILALSPDLVIVAEEAGPPAAIEQLKAAGVRVERMPQATTIEATAARILKVGEAIGRPGTELAERVQREATAAVNAVPKDGPTFVMMFARGAGSMMLAGDDTSGSTMVQLAGGKPAVSGFNGYKAVSAEALISASPQVIVVPAHTLKMIGGIEGVLKLPGVAETPAGKAKRIVAFDDLLLLGFGPRLAKGVEELSRALSTSAAT